MPEGRKRQSRYASKRKRSTLGLGMSVEMVKVSGEAREREKGMPGPEMQYFLFSVELRLQWFKTTTGRRSG